ncbi:MAG: hypothetical protein HOP23_14965 [Methylococcaceae bacterium]|nr:hypothetical protein [Methylococcaceae bacterium]
MLTTDEKRQQLLTELIEQSAQIDSLVVKSRQASPHLGTDYSQELEILRAKQRETTEKLHALEEFSSTSWENIGDGG